MAERFKCVSPAVVSIVAALVMLQSPQCALGCAGVGPAHSTVKVVDESAVIVWDAANHVEHFIRRASFRSDSRDFGFLVPTPSAPTLTAAHDSAYTSLEQLIAPKVIFDRQTNYALGSLFFPRAQAALTAMAGMKSSSVQVLDSERVAGYDATVLSADKADDLLEWLKVHDYVARPELLDWLTPYVQAHWVITAFKVSNDQPNNVAPALSAVRMSFKTDKPFFPYREPPDAREAGMYSTARSLRVFVLSDSRMQGTIGGAPGSPVWPGRVVYANPVTRANVSSVVPKLALSARQLPANCWLTTFEDRSSPRPGTDDVYFAPSPSQTPVIPPPTVIRYVKHVNIPVEPFVLVGGLAVFCVRATQKRKRYDKRTYIG